MALRQLAHPAQVPRGVHPDPGRALHQRLHDHRRDLLGVGVEHALELGGVSGLDAVRLEQEGRVGGVEEVDAADGDRPQGVAVIGVSQADEGGAPPVLPPSCCQYWNAILSAISVALEPESE